MTAFSTFKERFEYLKLCGSIGEETFGVDRYLNQMFYRSQEWKNVRRAVIMRDNGCDLGLDGFEIHGPIIIHHINPITVDDILDRSSEIMDPEFLICTSIVTHNAIHYGAYESIGNEPLIRTEGDTKLW